MYDVAIITDDQSGKSASTVLKILTDIDVSHNLFVISADSAPEDVSAYCLKALKNNAKVFIIITGTSTALPKIVIAATNSQRPVLGAVLSNETIGNQVIFSAMINTPTGSPLNFCGTDGPGLANAAISACQIIAVRGRKAITANLSQWLLKQNTKKAQ